MQQGDNLSECIIWLFEYLEDNALDFPAVHNIQFPEGIHRDDLVITAGSFAAALLVDDLGDGVLLEASDFFLLEKYIC
ncbi:hypothetical protein COCNU_09G010100 [Cocos nucifera]|uniref:Uncharacterized protein n=1 Tax=Cocos nucifera TaxID=13894 RepID=A0A8K0N779_COCNU|nr:hypothetical protein COCNU_09G010100 [Cocos nucifera]